MAFMRDPLYILMQDKKVRIWWGPDRDLNFNCDQDLFDMVVMMRYYNMTEEERRAAIDRVLETQFETGADGVRKASGRSTVMERVSEELEFKKRWCGVCFAWRDEDMGRCVVCGNTAMRSHYAG